MIFLNYLYEYYLKIVKNTTYILIYYHVLKQDNFPKKFIDLKHYDKKTNH